MLLLLQLSVRWCSWMLLLPAPPRCIFNCPRPGGLPAAILTLLSFDSDGLSRANLHDVIESMQINASQCNPPNAALMKKGALTASQSLHAMHLSSPVG